MPVPTSSSPTPSGATRTVSSCTRPRRAPTNWPGGRGRVGARGGRRRTAPGGGGRQRGADGRTVRAAWARSPTRWPSSRSASRFDGLRDGGADVAWIETMSAVEEVHAAATAAIAEGMPYVVTCSFDTAGRTMMGLLAVAPRATSSTASRSRRWRSAPTAAWERATFSSAWWRWPARPSRWSARATAGCRSSSAPKSSTPARPN